ncbi:hypothetical protein KIN34_14425 [Cellulomonas sp. DKR-3]|uniref:Uncharacterized protein n=1 Tax=Cellulomonas fulva TaxID=2835530 RepID=A0ABS5U269_9CELL|nr:hypothetical protein [Cellulomonas fulva]MBT0995479.1 hypothetical protein [Cellulomonas fulva]
MAPPHPLQESLDYLPEYLGDAGHLFEVVEERNAALTRARRAAGNKTGAGSPPVTHKSLNRAVVVAAVGALEAFCEDLALRAQPLVPGAVPPAQWYAIAGTRGMVQTPNSNNIAKLFWTIFRYDPRPDWDLLLDASWAEVGSGTRWRGTTISYKADAAARALDAMVQVRHGFAHQDKASAPKSTPGVVEVTSTQKLSLQSHHARNAMSMVVQVAVLTTHGLSTMIPGTSRPLRWKAAMKQAGWGELLAGTPAAAEVKSGWTGHPF